MTGSRLNRRADTVNRAVMVIGSVALTVLATMVGYLLVEDREKTAIFRTHLLDQFNSLENKVIRLEATYRFCDCAPTPTPLQPMGDPQ